MIFASLLLLLVGVLQVHARCDETFSYIGNSGQIRLTKMCDNGTSFLDFKIETIEERSGPGNGKLFQLFFFFRFFRFSFARSVFGTTQGGSDSPTRS